MSEHDDQTVPDTDEDQAPTEPDDERAAADADRAAAEPDDERATAEDPDPAEPEGTADEDQAPAEPDDSEASAAPSATEDHDAEEAEETRRRQEEFAREHDPADHDVDAGEEFRQPGDWTADEDGPQELETDRSMLAATGSATTGEGGADGSGATEGGADGSGSTEGDADGGSSEEEIRDGGHGWGSAAPRADGGAPEGHPVKAWHDTMTFVLPDEEGYDAEAHEYFVDGETAERAGFRHAHG
ncbi:hypothetical protein AVL62_10790 [Serinicoccus chungangensis]|uniref:Uncharacterized protein n=1 Tax=Serinicoccus chungangensis TaxID=767452 RepID=A0A0W8IEN8_9MICO|nr:hypothetical protein [Serinicoccus chungangensis]KUG58392.1 hypothetical protein AVL62_10790 [Serinicoccus chungangensis]